MRRLFFVVMCGLFFVFVQVNGTRFAYGNPTSPFVENKVEQECFEYFLNLMVVRECWRGTLSGNEWHELDEKFSKIRKDFLNRGVTETKMFMLMDSANRAYLERNVKNQNEWCHQNMDSMINIFKKYKLNTSLLQTAYDREKNPYPTEEEKARSEAAYKERVERERKEFNASFEAYKRREELMNQYKPMVMEILMAQRYLECNNISNPEWDMLYNILKMKFGELKSPNGKSQLDEDIEKVRKHNDQRFDSTYRSSAYKFSRKNGLTGNAFITDVSDEIRKKWDEQYPVNKEALKEWQAKLNKSQQNSVEADVTQVGEGENKDSDNVDMGFVVDKKLYECERLSADEVEHIAQKCDNYMKSKYLFLTEDNTGYYTDDDGKTKTDITWEYDEEEPNTISVLLGDKFESYEVKEYKSRYYLNGFEKGVGILPNGFTVEKK